ncbi:hypothetical protein [Pseudomonas sp.]|uniref:hypothetical protein n=1 Tax=Pseudomonas sp. TaxID=306 RepID=UPI002579D492|nr:hypothetical protein [Pseudomonas sp.]
MSSPRQTHTQTRDAVLRAHANDMIARTNLSARGFATALSKAFHASIIDSNGSHSVPDFEAMNTGDADTFMKVSDTWLKRVQRWLADEVDIPAWLEEPWVQALLPEWRDRCLIELSARYGLLAVRPVSAHSGDAMQVFAGISTNFGHLAGIGGEVFADGVFNHLDASNAGAMENHCRALAAYCVAMADKAAQVKAVH